MAASRIRHPLDARTLARLAAQYAGEGPGEVVGFGLSNDERRGVTEEFAPAFQIARHAGLALVPHAGELLGPAAVEATLESLWPDRLGHGVRSAEDPRVLEMVAESGVALEVCPGSNVALGVYGAASEVPLRTIVEPRHTRWRSAPTTRCCSGRGSRRSTRSRGTRWASSDAELADAGPRLAARPAGRPSRSGSRPGTTSTPGSRLAGA